MSLLSLWKVLGSFGSLCWTGLVPFPELPLLFELLELELFLFLLESDTPTPTPMAMTARRPTRAPMSYGDGMSQFICLAHKTRPLAKSQDSSPATNPLLRSTANKIEAIEGRTINFDLRLPDCCFSSHAEEVARPPSLPRWE